MNTVLTLVTGSFVALSGFIISRLGDNFQFDSLLFTACVGLSFLYVLIIYSFKNIQPKDYIVAGTPAADLFHPAFFSGTFADKDRILRYYVNEIENSFYKTQMNNDLNKVRWKRFSLICKSLVVLPLVLLLCYACTI